MKFTSFKKSLLGLVAISCAGALADRITPAGTTVVFMGDSITRLWKSGRGDFFQENGFIGKGYDGQTTFNMLDRFNNDVVNAKPDAVVITAGTNDIAENGDRPFDVDVTMNNIKEMVTRARNNGIKVVMAQIPPSNAFWWNKAITDIPSKIKALNAKIKAYADAEGLFCVDFYTSMVGDNECFSPSYAYDGVHPKVEGFLHMESLLMPMLIDTLNGKAPVGAEYAAQIKDLQKKTPVQLLRQAETLVQSKQLAKACLCYKAAADMGDAAAQAKWDQIVKYEAGLVAKVVDAPNATPAQKIAKLKEYVATYGIAAVESRKAISALESK